MLFVLLLVASADAAPGSCDAAVELYKQRRWPEAAAAYALALDADAPSASASSWQQADSRLGYARALKKLGAFGNATRQLAHLRAAVGSRAELSAPERQKVEASVLLEEASIRACAGELSGAIASQEKSLGLVVRLAHAHKRGGAGGLAVAPREITSRLLELGQLYSWVGRGDDAERARSRAQKMGGFADPLQLPAGEYVPNVAPAKAWHDAAAYPSLRAAVDSLAAFVPRLQAEYDAASVRSALKVQNECLHTDGAWSYLAVTGAHVSTPAEGCGANSSTPVACEVAAAFAGAGLVRVGYSVLSAGATIREHHGPTNVNLKIHLGIRVPLREGEPCALFTVGDVTKAWTEGGALLFDDSFKHTVTSRCSKERVVLQIVVRHPSLHRASPPLKTDEGGAVLVTAAAAVLVTNRTGKRLFSPLLQHSMGGDANKGIMLRAQTTADAEGSAAHPNLDAVFLSTDLGKSWAPLAMDVVQKRMCLTVAPAASGGVLSAHPDAETAALCLPYAYQPAVQAVPVTAACEAALSAFLNNDTLNGACINAQAKQWKRSIKPYVQLDEQPHIPGYDPRSFPKEWRFWSHEALGPGGHSSNASKTPKAFCSGPSSTLTKLGHSGTAACSNPPGAKVPAVRNASLWVGLANKSVVRAHSDSIPVSFEANLLMHVAGSAIPSSVDKNVLLTTLYEETAGPDYIVVYESKAPHTQWTVRARVAKPSPENSGGENWLCRLTDSRIVMILRDWSGATAADHQLSISVSKDDGHTWRAPVAMKGEAGTAAGSPHHVAPKLFLLSNGVLILTSGREGAYAWTLPVSDLLPGKEGDALWTGLNLLGSHHTGVKANAKPMSCLFPANCVAGKLHSPGQPCSTYYTSVNVLPTSAEDEVRDAASIVVTYDNTPAGWNVPTLGKQWGLIFSTRLTVTSGGTARRQRLKSDDDVLSVADFGAVTATEGGGAPADACLSFNRTIAACRRTSCSRIRIPRGTYHFFWHSCGERLMYVSNTVVTPLPPKPIALWLRELSNVVVEGEHSVLLMLGRMTPIAVDHSKNVAVRNLEVDFPHPSVVEAEVTKAAADGKSLERKVHEGNNLTVAGGNVNFGSFGEGWTLDGEMALCQEFDPDADITWRTKNVLQGASVTAVPGDAQSMTLTFSAAQTFKLGNHYWWRSGDRRNAGIITQFSSAVTFDGVTMRFQSGFGMVAQMTTHISYLNVTSETTRASGRHCSCSADLLHFSGCAGHVNISGGRYVGSQDDVINVHGTHLQIVEQPTPKTIVVQFMQHESYGFQAFFAGNRLQFTRSDTLEAFGFGTVKAVKMLSAKGCAAAPTQSLPCQQRLELEAPLVARLKQDVVENLSFAAAALTVRGAYFSRVPTRGLLVTTRGRVRISNNTIHTPRNRALHIADDAASWYESGQTADVEFSHNIVLRNTVQGQKRAGPTAVIDVAPSNTENATVHRNLKVLNNELRLHAGATETLLALKSIAGVVLRGNKIFLPGRPLKPSELVAAVNCTGIVVEGNTIITTAAIKTDDLFALDLQPAAPADSGKQAYRNSSASSWGGNVVFSPKDKLYHLFNAAMTCKQNLGGWTSNSHVIHSTSTSPLGPFSTKDVSLAVWHHNPQAMLHPDGTWLLFTIGTRNPQPKQKGCTTQPHRLGGPKTGEFVQLHHAQTPSGPWTFLNLTGNASAPGIFGPQPAGPPCPRVDRNCHTAFGTNPTPWILANGTMIVGSHDSQGFYIQVAPSWRGPYHRLPGHLFVFEQPPPGYQFEDPYLYFDQAAGKWRCLLHQYSRAVHPQYLVGGIASSATASILSKWTLQTHTHPVYTTRVNTTGGRSELMGRRERPKLYLNQQTGAPEVLYTGVCPLGKQGSFCYTHAQPIGGAFKSDDVQLPTPPAGWRSWNQLGGGISQKIMESMMQGLVDKSRTVDGKPTSLLDLGYSRIGMDECVLCFCCYRRCS